MVLNKDYNAEEDWEVVSDESAPDQAQTEEEQDAITPTAAPKEEVPSTSPVESTESEETSTSVESSTITSTSTDTSSNSNSKESTVASTANSVASIAKPPSEDATTTKAANTTNNDAVASDEKEEQEPLLKKETAEHTATEKPSTETEKPNEQQKPEPQPTPSTGSSNRKPSLPGWLQGSIAKIGSALQEADAKHHLQHRARSSVKTVGDSLTKLGDSIQKEATTAKAALDRESIKLTQTIEQKADEVDWKNRTRELEAHVMEAAAAVDDAAFKLAASVKESAMKAGDAAKTGALKAGDAAKTAGASVKTTATKAGATVQEMNKDGKVTDFLAAVAMVSGAVLMARGKTGAGAGVMAAGGAAFAAGEGTRASQRRYDSGLNENLHMD